MGHKFKSFNQKNRIIKSSVNTLQTTFVLTINFAEAAVVINTCPANSTVIKETVYTYDSTAPYKLQAFYMHTKVTGSIK